MTASFESTLERRVAAAAEAAVAADQSVSLLDVLNGIGWLPSSTIRSWQQGRVDHLTPLAAVSADKLSMALTAFTRWARDAGLEPHEVDYVAGTRNHRQLRFTRDADPAVERVFRTHWVSPQLSAKRQERLTERKSKPPELAVIMPLRDWTCASCGESGDLLFMENNEPYCLACVDMDHLVFLPAGDAALTRRAKKESRLSARVVRFSRTRKRYERQGILVEEAALERAEEQCLADEDARSRRRERDRDRRSDEDAAFQTKLAEEILRLFPGCQPNRATAIARHTATRGSGRVGRTASGRALDQRAVTAAVVASIRHEDTRYDELLMAGVFREDARENVRADVDRFLDTWRHPRSRGEGTDADPARARLR